MARLALPTREASSDHPGLEDAAHRRSWGARGSTVSTKTSYRLHLPYQAPPLSANQRLHWPELN